MNFPELNNISVYDKFYASIKIQEENINFLLKEINLLKEKTIKQEEENKQLKDKMNNIFNNLLIPITTKSHRIGSFYFNKVGQTIISIPQNLDGIPNDAQILLLRTCFFSGNEGPSNFNLTLKMNPINKSEKPVYERYLTYLRYKQDAISFDNHSINLPLEGYERNIILEITKEALQLINCHGLHLYIEGYYPKI